MRDLLFPLPSFLLLLLFLLLPLFLFPPLFFAVPTERSGEGPLFVCSKLRKLPIINAAAFIHVSPPIGDNHRRPVVFFPPAIFASALVYAAIVSGTASL